MRRLSEFMFARMEGKGDELLPFTRWDIFLSVILGTLFMIAIAYSAEPQGWSVKRGLLVGVAAIVVTSIAQNRKVALGCGLGLVAFRMGIGMIAGPHAMIFMAGTIVAGWAAWLLLHDLE